MGVDTPTLLAVLAHEVRGPVSVLQGYLRLLEQRRAGSDSDAATIEAMRRSTARLAELGRDASVLSGWLKRTAPEPARQLLSALMADIASKTALAKPRDAEASLSAHAVRTTDAALLAQTLATLVLSVSRDHDNGPCHVATTVDGRCAVIDIAPEGAPSESRSGAKPAEQSLFDRGGMGLALVLASHVLDAHGARVQVANHGGVIVHLPLAESRR